VYNHDFFLQGILEDEKSI